MTKIDHVIEFLEEHLPDCHIQMWGNEEGYEVIHEGKTIFDSRFSEKVPLHYYKYTIALVKGIRGGE